MRRSWVWLRLASVAFVVLAVGHGSGMFEHPGGAGGDTVLTVMRVGTFEMMGVQRSYYAFYWGLGWCLTVNLILLAVLLWNMATRARTDAASVRPMVVATFVASVALSVLSWVYFVPAPGIMSTLAALFLVAALLTG